MKLTSNKPLDQIFGALFKPYAERVPDVKKITAAMVDKGMVQDQSDIINDHVAFRTLGAPHLGLQSFEKIFLHYGYERRDHYFFEKKRLDAYWYAPPEPHYPRAFISELRVQDLSDQAQGIIHKYISDIDHDPVDDLDLDDPTAVGDFFHKPLWELVSHRDYTTLLEESEYAAWVIYNRYYLNHYTISVHDLPNGFNQLESFNAFLKEIGVKLNDSGGEIKTSPDGLLRQTSSVAGKVMARFSDNKEQEIAGSYVEFAERGVLPQFQELDSDKIGRSHRRDGFATGNADKIFESTYTTQTER